ncbi:ribosome biogenesis protein BOP1 homolog [Zerene cesonia]|uniref:ribosome biogenesis protein BOP1 homolog n=1 Tax=Zerene cesonia TaxID=33412 RepID=UPI0018E50F5F|nr:ribosome biogenesis protein BOP1 homolog [Zerene cesonia]
MPPFRAGLLKRKIEAGEGNKSSIHSKNAEKESATDNDEDLIKGDLDHGDDATDSEHEQEADSDVEQDKVLFEDSADSVLGDEDQSADDSSDLTDSEEEVESNEDSEENAESTEDESPDSGAESAGNAPLAASSDINKNIKTNDRKKPTPKKSIKKGNKKNEDSVELLANKISEAAVTTEPVQKKDEYESGDTSDEEDRVNTAGDVPMWWYNEYPHIGYNLDGQRIAKPPQRDQIDEFLKKCEDPEFWRTVKDPATGQDVILSKDDLKLIERIRKGHIPSETHDEYEPWVEWFSREVLATPLRAFPEHKRSFLPSREEQLHVARIVHALKMGWTKTRRQLALERKGRREKKFYDLWGSSAEGEGAGRGGARHIPAPRRAPPSHAESYNPPPEYLLDKKEMKEWDKLSETPWKRKHSFLPTRHAALRLVPAYGRFVRERFLRCLDLYLAPRAIKMRLTINAEDLVPKLPSPRDLQPFPTGEVLQLRGHAGLVRAVDFDPSGQYVLSGGDDGTLRVWETSTGRCLRTLQLGGGGEGGAGEGGVSRAAWTPAGGLSLVAGAVGARLLLLNPGAGVGAHRVAARTDELLRDAPPSHDVVMDERTRSCVTWETVSDKQWASGVRISIKHFKPIAHLSWHARGDYLAVTLREGAARAVVVHQLSRRRSQLPFRTAKGLVQCAAFHPHRPHLFVATQRAVRVYDLARQELVRKLETGAQWVSCLAPHPRGDNLLVGAYDRKLAWFDLELSARPYQTLRLHGGAVRSVAFSARYPLFASAGDDPCIVVSHGMVYNDLLQNPLLVPLKQLRGGEKRDELCVLEVRFHPTQPWLIAACADGTIRLYA